jgi:beta-glucanase (GH16 family)
MKSIVIALGVFVLGNCGLSAQTEQNVRPLSAKDGETWKIRWDRSDDFNGDQVDWKKWQLRPEKFFAWAWDNEKNTAVADGHLTITIRSNHNAGPSDKSAAANNNKSKASESLYTSGMLKSYARDNYGYYEARIKGAPVFPGVCPAFWLYSSIDDSAEADGAVRYSEVDIVEMTQRGDRVEGNEKITDHNLHAILSNGRKGIPGRGWQRPNNPAFSEKQAIEYHAPFDPREDFHTYGCSVGKESIIWYVDGVEIGRKQNEFWHRPMNVALSFGLRAPFAIFKDNRLMANPEADASELPTTMTVDYVRVWNLPVDSE